MGYTSNFGPDPYVRAEIVNASKGLVRYSPSTSKVAIVGAGPGRERAPYDDPSWIVWGINEIDQKRITAWYELHPMSVQNARELEILCKFTVPVYVLELDERVPMGVRFPIEAVISAFGRRYFTCTFAYQVALAIWLGFDEIGLWGCGLHEGTARERLVERPCLDYWIGRAEGAGVRIAEDSGLARQDQLYGYAYSDEAADVDAQVARMRAVIEYEAGGAAS